MFKYLFIAIIMCLLLSFVILFTVFIKYPEAEIVSHIILGFIILELCVMSVCIGFNLVKMQKNNMQLE